MKIFKAPHRGCGWHRSANGSAVHRCFDWCSLGLFRVGEGVSWSLVRLCIRDSQIRTASLRAIGTCRNRLSFGDVWAVLCFVCAWCCVTDPAPYSDRAVVGAATLASTVLVQVVVPTVRDILGIPECPVGGPVRLALGVALGRLPLLWGISLAFPLGGCVTFAGLSPLGVATVGVWPCRFAWSCPFPWLWAAWGTCSLVHRLLWSRKGDHSLWP